MSDSVELAIRDLLISEKSSANVAAMLIKRLQNSPRKDEIPHFINFLLHTGHIKDVLQIYAEWIKSKQSFQIKPLLTILQQLGFKPQSDFFDQLFKLQQDCTEADQLKDFQPWIECDSRLAQLKTLQNEKLQQIQIERKENFNRKLAYLRSSRMVEEEKKLLKELIELYPHDERYKIDYAAFKERWARDLISRKSLEKLDETNDNFKAYITPAEQQAAQPIIAATQEYAKANAQAAYDLALLLYNMELYHDAFHILALAPLSPAVDWLNIELLIKTKRYVQCLDTLYKIEVEYANDPETVFATTYYRAITLNGLGQNAPAVQLLQSLVNIRPNYRSALSLLHKWGGAA